MQFSEHLPLLLIHRDSYEAVGLVIFFDIYRFSTACQNTTAGQATKHQDRTTSKEQNTKGGQMGVR